MIEASGGTVRMIEASGGTYERSFWRHVCKKLLEARMIKVLRARMIEASGGTYDRSFWRHVCGCVSVLGIRKYFFRSGFADPFS